MSSSSIKAAAEHTKEQPACSHALKQLKLPDAGDILGLIEQNIDQASTRVELIEFKEDSFNSGGDLPKQPQGLPTDINELLPIEGRKSLDNQQNISPVQSPQSRVHPGSVLVSSSFKKKVPESAFCRNDSHISLYLQQENISELAAYPQPKQGPLAKSGQFRATRPQALVQFLLAISSFAFAHKFEVVNFNHQGIIVRKNRSKSLIEQLVLSFHEPVVLQFVCNFQQCRLELVCLAGVLFRVKQTSREFEKWRSQVQLVLWKTRELLIDQEASMRIFLQSHHSQLQGIRSAMLACTVRPIRQMAQRKKCDLYGRFSRVMDYREVLLTDMHNLSLDTIGCVRALDRRLLAATGMDELHRQYYQLLERELEKRRKEVSQLTAAACLQLLEVDQQYRLPNSAEQMPYQRAIDQLNTLEQRQSIEEKLTCTIRWYTLIRECVISHYCGRRSIENMDNMLPLVIYILLYSRSTNVVAEMALLENHIAYKVECGSDCEMERRIILNVQVALEYIISSWEAEARPKHKCW